jgi:hypothetical protein
VSDGVADHVISDTGSRRPRGLEGGPIACLVLDHLADVGELQRLVDSDIWIEVDGARSRRPHAGKVT